MIACAAYPVYVPLLCQPSHWNDEQEVLLTQSYQAKSLLMHLDITGHLDRMLQNIWRKEISPAINSVVSLFTSIPVQHPVKEQFLNGHDALPEVTSEKAWGK